MAKRGQAGRPTGRTVPTKPKRAPADVDLKKEIATLRLELAEVLERQTATSEVLQVISGTPSALAPIDITNSQDPKPASMSVIFGLR
jgi:hypothetical protein